MNDWAHGYDVSVGYSYGFWPEMAPDWLDLCARVAGFAPRRREGRSFFRYLELGCGQGMGLCLLAAANPQAEFVGVDFQPDHVAHANGVATAAGLGNVRFLNGDFVALAAAWPDDLGQFDYVAMHGVYTWVSPQVRAAVIACLGHATRAGSLVYNGYNAQPGWLATMPFQHISRSIKETTGQPSGAVFDASIALFDRLRAGGANIFQILPGLAARLDSVRSRSASYLTHEYLHDYWQPLWHSQVAKELARIGLDYVGPATVAEALSPDALPPPLRAIVAEQQDKGLRQDVQDFVINQVFRRDIYCRDPKVDFPREATPRTELHLVAAPAGDGTITIKAAFGEIRLERPAYAEIVDALASGPRTTEALTALPGMRRQGIAATRQVLLLLLHMRVIAAGAAMPGAAEIAQRLNGVIANGASEGLPYESIAASMLGSAIAVTNIELLMLDCWMKMAATSDPTTLANGVVDRLHKLGRSVDDPHSALPAAATAFIERTVPHWRRLGALA